MINKVNPLKSTHATTIDTINIKLDLILEHFKISVSDKQPHSFNLDSLILQALNVSEINSKPADASEKQSNSL